MSQGIKLFLLVAVPWGTACERGSGFFQAYKKVLTLLSFVIIGKCQLEAILQVFSTALSQRFSSEVLTKVFAAVLY